MKTDLSTVSNSQNTPWQTYKVFIFAFLILFFSRCEYKSIDTKSCTINDSRLIGTWKLVEECICYSNGDSLWQKYTGNVYLSFNNSCLASIDGEVKSVCNAGSYTARKDTLNVIFTCPNGSTATNTYIYFLNSKNDTLTLNAFLDDLYDGSKYIRK